MSASVPRRRWWCLMLACSVGLNVLLGAALATREIRLLLAPKLADMTLGEAREQPQLALHTVLAGLPAADATLLRRAFLTHVPALLTARMKLRTALQAVRADVEQPIIDPTALHAAVLAAQQARADLGTLAAGLLEAEAPKLSVEGRRRLAGLGK